MVVELSLVFADLVNQKLPLSCAQASSLASRAYPMTAPMVMGFAILAAFALGFVIGRIWQSGLMGLQRRASFPMPSVARIPCPRDV